MLDTLRLELNQALIYEFCRGRPDSLNFFSSYDFYRKISKRFKPPETIRAIPHGKRHLSAIKLEFHTADMPRQGKQKVSKRIKISLLYFTSCMMLLAFAMHATFILVVKLWWRRNWRVGGGGRGFCCCRKCWVELSNRWVMRTDM